MAVLVTGGAGYIGSHAVHRLQTQGHQVVVFDSLEFGHRGAVPPGVPLVVGDIGDEALISRVCRTYDVDSVIHFAGYKNAGESVHVPERYFENNVVKGKRLLDGLRSAGVNRLVFSSTCAVYGTPEAVPVDESAALNPESPYGESKLMFERLLRWYSTCHGMQSVSLRYFNAAGASMESDLGEDWTVTMNLVPLVMKALLEPAATISVFGTDYPTRDGTAIRDYIHVDDLADAHLRALGYLETGGATTSVNLGTGVGSSVLEVIAAAERAAGRSVPTEFLGRRTGDPVRVYADNRRAIELFSWQPVYGLDEIVASAYRWHAAHPDGFGL